MANTREQIIETACDLLECQGYHATGLNQIVQESGSPKGSLYYYFPEGKEAIAAEAVRLAGSRTAEHISVALQGPGSAAEALREFIGNIARHIEESGFRMGGPLMMVSMETATTSERLNLACREAYAMLQQAFYQRLLRDGFDDEQSAQLAVFINASIEGGIVLSRTAHSGDPLRSVGEIIYRILAK